MSWNRQMELHYINTGFPYTVTESFMNLFDGLTYAHTDFAHAEAMHDQETANWAMHMGSAYKFGLSGPGSASYYGNGHPYDGVNDHLHRMDAVRMVWENSSTMNNEEFTSGDVPLGENTNTSTDAISEECIRSHHYSSSSQVTLQDNVDPDNMTYEELLDLGEAVGTQNRGLSEERISLLPISKFKRGFFSRKKSQGDRCVICQMEFKNGDRLITLPCKHFYHVGCGKKWLSINKACPVCYTDVFDEDSRH